MTATIHADRPPYDPDVGERVRPDAGTATATVVDAISPSVPDRVPGRLAAEHPDAAATVAGRARPPVPVRVTSRGEERRSPARTILGLVAGAALAAFAAGSPDPAQPVEPPVAARRPAPVITERAATAGPGACGWPGASVVVRCEPSCQRPWPLALTAACAPAAGSRTTGPQ